jgi:ABC-type polysaccharide/polyol phosphate export permease
MIIIISRIKKLYKLLPPLLSRDIKERYAGSVLGIFWTFLQPLLFILIYWMVFSQILRIRIQTDTGDIPFIAFLLSGLLPWFALQEGVLRGASAILDKRHVIKKVLFPVELFPLASVMSAFIHHGVGIVLFLLGFFIWQGSVSFLQISFIIVLISLQILLTSGLSLFFSSLSVYIRDITQILGVVFQVLFYMSTILYPITSVPETFKGIILLNPFTVFTEAFHNVILYNRYPGTGNMIFLLCMTAAIFFGGIYIFRKLKKGFADVV